MKILKLEFKIAYHKLNIVIFTDILGYKFKLLLTKIKIEESVLDLFFFKCVILIEI